MAPAGLRSSFAANGALVPFYTGGPARLSPDGRVLAAACGDDAQLVDAAGGAVLATIPGDSEPVTALAFSHDGAALYTASRSMQCRRWEVGGAEPSCSRTWKAHALPVNDIAVDAAGALLATCSADRTARVWDASRGYCTHALKGHEAPVLCCAFHPHARRLLLFTASEDTTVRAWDLASKGACAAVLRGHFSAVTSLAVACGGGSAASAGHLLSAGRDKVVTVWRLADYAKAATVPVYEALEGVVALPPGAPLPGAPPASAAAQQAAGELGAVRFATAGERGTLRVWAAAGAACLHEAARDPGAAAREAGFTSLQLLPAAAGLAVTTSDCRVLFYAQQAEAAPPKPGKAAKGEAAAAAGPRLALTRQLLGDLDEVVDARFLPPPPCGEGGGDDAPRALVVATNSAVLSVLDARTLACTASLAGHADTVLCLDAASAAAAAAARAPRGAQLVASAGKDRSLRLWDAAAGRCLASAEGHAAAVTAVAFGARSAALLVTGGADKLLKVWDASAAIATAATAAPAPEGAKLLRVTAAVAAHEKEVNAVAVAPTDALVASGGADRLIKLWALPALLPRGTLRGHKRGVWSLAFSPLDAVLASASGDRTLRLWNCADGSCVRTLEGHAAGVLKLAWLTAGTQLASGGADGCVRVWSVAAGESLLALEAHEGRAWALAAAADGAALLSGGADGALRLWRDATAETAAAAAAAEDAAAADEQALANATRAGDFGAALALGLRLGRPAALHALLAARLAQPGGARLDAAVAALPEEALGALLAHCAEWNANSRTCAVAQAALAALLRAAPPARVAKLPNAPALLDALHAYTQRHFARMDRLVRATYLLDFTLAQQGAIVDSDDEDNDDHQGEGAAGPSERAEMLRAAAGVRATPASAARAAAARAAADTLRGDDDDFADVALPGWGGSGDADSSEEEEEAPPPVKRKRARAGEAEEEAPAAKGRKAAPIAAPQVVATEKPAAASKARKAAAAAAPPADGDAEAAEEPAPPRAKRAAAAKEAPGSAPKSRRAAATAAAEQAAEEAEEPAPAKRASARGRKAAPAAEAAPPCGRAAAKAAKEKSVAEPQDAAPVRRTRAAAKR